jgi:hypothetical protein
MLGRKICILLLVLSGLTFLSVSNAAAQQTTIMGQNNPAADIQAVQKAVDQGGSILLKGAFDFGDKGRVNITKDVKIIGETDNGGKPVTKIKGGFWTFHSPLPSKLPPVVLGPKITIQGIHFDGALWVPIHLAHSSGATISNNKITNVRPKLMDEPVFGKPGLNRQQGIACLSGYVQPIETRKYIPNAITGNLIIEDNDIDLTNEVPTKTMSQGVLVFWTTGINAQIQRNTVINCARNSIEAIDNFLGKDGSGMVIIKENKIVNSVEGIPVPTPATPNGMVVGWFLDISGGLDPQRNIKYVVVNNGIRTRGKTSVGIAAFTDGIVVVNNTILSEGTEALPLAVSSSDGYIAYNRMEGMSSRPAILIRLWKPLKGSKNVLVDNDLRQFKSSAADVVFDKDTCDNLFIGPSCKVNDLGSNNSIQVTK